VSVEADFATVADALVTHDGSVQRDRIFRSDGLKTGDRFFAFVRRGELVVKVPADRVSELIASGEGQPLRSGKRVMREWVTLEPADAEAVAGYVTEARRFAGGNTGGGA
jgi:hypothetical protein